MRLLRLLAPSLVLALGCAREAPNSSQPLLVGAPPALRETFDGVAAAFNKRHPETMVNIVYGTPEQLAASGVPLDAVAADAADGLRAFEGRLQPGERRDYAGNPLVLVTRAGAPADLHVKALPLTPWVQRIALADGRGDPSGAAAEAALGRLALRRPLDDRLQYVGTPQMVLERVTRAQADAGFVFSVDAGAWNAAHPDAQVQLAERVDEPHAHYPIAVVKGTPRLDYARLFIDELLHGEGPKLLAARGLLQATR